SAAVGTEAAKEEIPPTVRQEPQPTPLPSAAPMPDAVPVPCAALAASPVPAAVSAEVDAQLRDEEIVIVLGDRRYRVRGLKKNLAFDVMLKVNVLITRGESGAQDGAFHVDTLDLYSVRARNSFIAQ